MWNQLTSNMQQRQQVDCEKNKAKTSELKSEEIAKMLEAALENGNIELAVLLLSGLETKKVAALATSLMDRIKNLQAQREDITKQLGNMGGDSKEGAQQANTLSMKAGDIGSDINMLQNFLQEALNRKNESQQFASNYVKSEHDLKMSIIHNMT